MGCGVLDSDAKGSRRLTKQLEAFELVRFDTYNGSRRSRYLRVGRNESHLIVLDAQGRERARLSDVDGIKSPEEIVDFLVRNSKLKDLGKEDPQDSPSAEPKDSQKR